MKIHVGTGSDHPGEKVLNGLLIWWVKYMIIPLMMRKIKPPYIAQNLFSCPWPRTAAVFAAQKKATPPGVAFPPLPCHARSTSAAQGPEGVS